MRTSFDIEDRLLTLARKQALEKGTSLKEVVESSLRQALLPPASTRTEFHLRWKTVRGKRIPALDLSDRDHLYEKMEGRG
jgi:hypothetical protein